MFFHSLTHPPVFLFGSLTAAGSRSRKKDIQDKTTGCINIDIKCWSPNFWWVWHNMLGNMWPIRFKQLSFGSCTIPAAGYWPPECPQWTELHWCPARNCFSSPHNLHFRGQLWGGGGGGGRGYDWKLQPMVADFRTRTSFHRATKKFPAKDFKKVQSYFIWLLIVYWC